MGKLTGKIALVTGSTGRIGEEAARELEEQGATVITHGTRHTTKTNHMSGDLTVEENVHRIVSEIHTNYGDIDILVCGAGGNRKAKGYGPPKNDDCLNIAMDEFWHQLNLNFTSAVYCCRAIVPAMMKKGWGRVVTVGSCLVHHPRPGSITATYACAKAALHEYTIQLASQVREHNITVNCVAPSSTKGDEPTSDNLIRYATPKEIGAVIGFLCSPDASYVSGEVIRVNGGNVRGQSWMTNEVRVL